MFIVNPTFILVAGADAATLRGEFRMSVDLCRSEGSLKILGIARDETVSDIAPRIQELTRYFQRHEVMTTASIVDSAGFTMGIVTGLQALGSRPQPHVGGPGRRGS